MHSKRFPSINTCRRNATVESIDCALAICSRWLSLAGKASTTAEINIPTDSWRSRESVESESKGALERASAVIRAFPEKYIANTEIVAHHM